MTPCESSRDAVQCTALPAQLYSVARTGFTESELYRQWMCEKHAEFLRRNGYTLVKVEV